jgi:hypothetical protein
MSSDVDRRAPGATRIPFEALVEVGGALGPSFEAQAVNISEDGMQLRTAYLPEAGQPLTCRFDAGPGQSVLASGEVVWAKEQGKGGEFAIRFTDVDPESIDVLRRMCGVAAAGSSPQLNAMPGSKVRLHIEGLASPMRARIKDSKSQAITVGSDLGFLQVGKELELEDAESGAKRPAKIDRVDVAVDPASRVPQLVVTLRYDGGDAEADADVDAHVKADDAIRIDEQPPKSSAEIAKDRDIEAAHKDMPHNDMKGAIARGVAAIGPTFAKLGARAKTTVALLAAKRSAAKEEGSMPRRTTAPAPGGGLHATGRRVIRGESTSDSFHEEAAMEGQSKFPKRKVAIAGAVVVAVVLGAIALRKPHSAPAGAEASATSAPTSAAESRTPSMAPPQMPGTMPAQAAMPQAAPTMAAPMGAPAPAFGGAMAGGAAPDMSDGADDATGKHGKDKKGKHGKIPPFGNGPVAHGNILHLKFDGPIDALQGAQQPTGFTVKMPGRKSVEAAGPLAARDTRIASIKVTNDPAGAELTVAFKDGVPNYQVRAKNETLEIALAPMGKAHNDHDKGKKDGKPTKVAAKKKHDKAPDKN